MRRFETIKLAMAVFIASEAVFFAFLIAAYIFYSGAIVRGPQAANSLDPPRTLIFTLCLLASSGTMWRAEKRLASRHLGGFLFWLAATIVLGLVFILGQIIEYAGLVLKSITPERNLFGATFFTLTGFHGFHVICGLISLCVLLGLSLTRTFESKELSAVAAVSMYWHFVDAVWIVIFSLIYVTVWV